MLDYSSSARDCFSRDQTPPRDPPLSRRHGQGTLISLNGWPYKHRESTAEHCFVPFYPDACYASSRKYHRMSMPVGCIMPEKPTRTTTTTTTTNSDIKYPDNLFTVCLMYGKHQVKESECMQKSFNPPRMISVGP